MVDIFPRLNFWDLLIPEINFFTGLGIIFILIGILYFGFVMLMFAINKNLASAILEMFDPSKLVLTLLGIGVILIWGTNFLINFLSTSRGVAIFSGIILTLFTLGMLFGKDIFNAIKGK